MPKVVVTALVEDGKKWEEGFLTHGDLFKSQTVTRLDYSAGEGNAVALYLEVDDVERYMQVMQSAATAEAMAVDGVRRETVQIFVLDKEFPF
jgi:hypothetical protein